MKQHFFTSTLFLFILFQFAGTLPAQDLDDAVIQGTVTDTDRAVVQGAKVSVRSEITSVRSTISDKAGRFRFVDLMPGVFEIEVSAAGFATLRKNGIRAEAGQVVAFDLHLSPGPVNEEVNVSTEDPPQIDPTRTVVGVSLKREDAELLPNPSEDILDLVFLLGGTDEEPFSIDGLADDDRIGGGSERDRPSEVTGAGSISLSGGAAFSTNVTIDGFDDNDDRSAKERFQPPPDSVAEVQVVSNQFSAEYGRASGGRVNIRTRSGSSQIRARVFASFADESLNANTYNNNRRGLGRLPFTSLEPGGSLQGPVPFTRNRTKFFSSFLQQIRIADSLIDTVVPVDQNPAYPLPRPTNPDERRVDDIPNPATDAFPAVDIAPYRKTVPTPWKRFRFLQRIDHSISDSSSLTVSYQMGRSDNLRQYRETTRYLEETLQAKRKKSDALNAQYDLVFGSRGVNQLRFQFSSHRPSFEARGSGDPVVLLFVSDDSRAGSDDQVRGTIVVGNSTANFASARTERRIQIQDSLTLLYGRHTFRTGADIQTVRSANVNLTDTTGTFNFKRVYDLLEGTPSRFRRNFGAASVQQNIYTGLFAQYEVSLKGGLTLTAGTRWESESLVRDRNNFGPRIAAAWAPFKNGRTVFRAGAGIFYNRVLLRTLDDYTLGRGTVRFDSEALAGPSNEARCLDQIVTGADAQSDKCRFLAALAGRFPSAPDLDQLGEMLESLDIAEGGFVTEKNFSRFVEQGIEVPESYQSNAGVERDLGKGLSVEINLTWNKASRLWRETNVNAFSVPEGFGTMTDYLLSLGTLMVGGELTRFVLGDPSDPHGVTEIGGVRTVNLATLNGSESRSAPIGIAFRALEETLSRPYDPELGQVEKVSDAGRSLYKGVSITFSSRSRTLPLSFRGSFRTTYTFSKTFDDGFVDTSSAQTPGDFRAEYAPSGIDRRHRLRFSGVFVTPAILGKITFAPAVRWESARPFNLGIGGRDRNLDDVGNDRPNFSGPSDSIVSRGPEDPYPYDLASRFSLAPIGTPGNLPRNSGRGPALFTFDASFSREFRLGRKIRVRPRIDVTNILNAKVFSFGSDYIDLSDNGSTEFQRGFLVPGRTLRQRRMVLKLKVDL